MLTAQRLVDAMTPAELARAELVESVLPALHEAAADADTRGEFPLGHVKTLSEAGLLGLVVPERFGGLGGTLRDLAGATFAMGTACPSTALAFFFHCSSASRGLLGLEALAAGLFTDPAEAQSVQAFCEKVLTLMGTERRWLANFASESVKSEASAITIATEATPVDGGWSLSGVKSFGCATGVADRYLVTAKLAGSTTAEGLCVFLVDRDAEGVGERASWDAIGMRATANAGITLDDVFVPAADGLGIPGAFTTMMRMSRGTFVGSQAAATAVYQGAAQRVYDEALSVLTKATFADTGRPIATSPLHQQLIGQMTRHLEEGYLWLRRQIELETSEPPLRPKPEVVRQWRLAKGAVCESAFEVAKLAVKACGTSQTRNSGVIARGLRDCTMGLVQAFPAERGLLEAAAMVTDSAGADFGVGGK